MNKSLDEIEHFVISKVREIRESKGITQEKLSLAIEKNITFISQVEAPSKPAKYNVIHLNLLAKALGCSSKDFFPDKPILEEKYSSIEEIRPKENKEEE